MKKKWKIFLTVITVLTLWLLYQITNHVLIFGTITLGIIILFLTKKNSIQNKDLYYLAALFFILFPLFSLTSFWILFIVIIVFILSEGKTYFDQLDNFVFKYTPWKKKEITVVETTDAMPKDGKKQKNSWIGNEKIGEQVYEWDDINLTKFAGDTIIDLGNTLLPKSESFIVLRKGFGRTRILVPTGIGILLEHSAVSGAVSFEGNDTYLRNETVKIYSRQYDSSNRKLKIITSVFIGDIEVITI